MPTDTKDKVATQTKGTRPSSRKGPADTPPTRLNVNINNQTATALRQYAEQHDVSITEAVRRLIAVGDFIAKAQDDEKQILLRDGNETERVVFTY